MLRGALIFRGTLTVGGPLIVRGTPDAPREP